MRIEDNDQEKFYDAIFNIRAGKKIPHTTIHHVIRPVKKIFTFRIIEDKSLYTAQIIETVNTNKIWAERRFSNKLEMAEWLWHQISEYKKHFNDLDTLKQELNSLKREIKKAG